MGYFKQLKANIQYGEYYRELSREMSLFLRRYVGEGKKVVIWGAGLKGNAFLSAADAQAEYVEAVVDMKESLHGTVLATGHKVVGREYVLEHAVDAVFIMNELFYVDNYFLLQKMGYKGRIYDVDYLVKHHVSCEQIYDYDFGQVDLDDSSLFGYTLQEIHEVLLEILKAVDRICRKHGISYFLEAGSALGAYRYQGMLPCDDDIDIAMLRDDYEHFLAVAKNELPEGLLLQEMSVGSQYPYPYAQVVKDHTCFVRYDFRKLNMHLGIHIDVAPLDNVSQESSLQKEQFERVRRITKLIRSKMLPEYFESRNPFKKLIVNGRYYLLKLVPLRVLMRRQWKEFTRYNCSDTGYVGDLCTHYKKIIVFEKKCLLPAGSLKFSGEEYPVPRDIDYYLGIMYDDYKTVSPRETGSVKYNLVAVSLNENYNRQK